MIGAAAYTLGMYRLCSLYTRAALGELLAMTFSPLVALGLYEILWGDVRRYPCLVLGATGIVGSHLLSVELVGIFCVLFVLVSLPRLFQRARILALLKATILTVLVNLWFLIPLLSYMRLPLMVNTSTPAINQSAIYPSQLFMTSANPAGWSLALGRTKEEMPLSVGPALGIGIVLFLLACWLRKENHPLDRRLDRLGRGSLLFGLTALLVSSTLFPWKSIMDLPVIGRVLAAVQFPWRYLGIATFFLSLVLAVAVYRLAAGRRHTIPIACTAVLLIAVTIVPYMDSYINKADAYLADSQALVAADVPQTVGSYEYYYKGTDTDALYNNPKTLHSTDSLMTFEGYEKEGTSLRFRFQGRGDSDTYVTLPLYAYPGYEGKLDNGENLTLDEGDNHKLRIRIPKGITQGSVSVRYTGLWYFPVAGAVSLVTLVGIGGWWLFRKLRQKRVARTMPN